MKHVRHASIAFLTACGVFSAMSASAQQANCTDVPQSMPLGSDVLAPMAAEVRPIIAAQLGSPSGVLTQAYDQAMSADMVVLRLRVDTCRKIAATLPSPSPANPNDPANYKPQSQWDNSPWRFNMQKGMTAVEFEAWMKSKGLHVSKGPPKPEATPAADVQGQPAVNGNPPQQTPAPVPVQKP
ncbi:hypothetical protein [Solilutibacter silvestris]|uniref:Secreted protein n=1 Tax=Solilutibacter silvestris TaxID=1645665 RepID=A0A2K1Q3K2_9GAMM|nr:hypothetical protein [Lysobacter silvestris]PNS09593.1 hypothetical protein Lysil_1222 [Lysobacter silvestris]